MEYRLEREAENRGGQHGVHRPRRTRDRCRASRDPRSWSDSCRCSWACSGSCHHEGRRGRGGPRL